MRITINNYGPEFRSHINLDVIHDSKCPPTGIFSALPKKFSFCVDDAVDLADRHVQINGRPPNALIFATDWRNLLRWEIANFWQVDLANNRYHHRLGGVSFTEEHVRRSGELLAEGIALLLISRSLKIPRQNFEFLEGTLSRCDYVFFRDEAGKQIPYGLEVRNRQRPEPLKSGISNNFLYKTDRDAMTKKKNGFNTQFKIRQGIGVYCFYGRQLSTGVWLEPRIHLIDPEYGGEPLSEAQVARRLATHYSGVVSRIGLWETLDRLEVAFSVLDKGDIPILEESRLPMYSIGDIRSRSVVNFNNDRYVGRHFYTLLQEDRTKSDILAQLRSGNFGEVSFQGVNVKILNLLNKFNWTQIAAFYDENDGLHEINGFPGSIASDGVMTYSGEIKPGSNEAKMLQQAYPD
jgi:hypothetical protein